MSAEEVRETHTPQISKRQVAIDSLTRHFVGWLKVYAPAATEEKIQETAVNMARVSYKIVKRAEGYEVQ